MDYEDILLEKKDGIATIILNNPEKFNAVTWKMRRSLLLAVNEVAKDDEMRVVIVTGAGRGFCAGADLTRGERPSESGEISRQTLLQSPVMYTIGEPFVKLTKPVIAAINGVCAGMGFSLILSCDIRIASETARFTSVFILRGMVPDNALTYLMPNTIGRSKALELMLTGDIISAAEAERVGIVSRVVPPNELMKVARELATRIAKQPPVAVELTKRVTNQGMADNMARQVNLESRAQQISTQTEDHKEAVRAFLEKRPPAPFKGR